MSRDLDERRHKTSPERQARIDAMAHEMMNPTIRDENEYRRAVEPLSEAKQRIVQQEAELAKQGFSPEEAKRVLDPMRSFYMQVQEEIERFDGRG